MTRAFAAPRELVWNAWADPKHIKAWWGPNGFTTTTLEAEIRRGIASTDIWPAWFRVHEFSDWRGDPIGLFHGRFTQPLQIIFEEIKKCASW